MRAKRLSYTLSMVSLALVASALLPARRTAHAQSAAAPLGPSLHFSHLTSDDGLLQNAINAIVQDSQGFMWIGTPAGLSRYDGYRFTPYEHTPQESNSPSQGSIRALYTDRVGMLWAAVEGAGIDEFDPLTETFTHYLADPQKTNVIPGDRYVSIFEDSAAHYWFGGIGLSELTEFDPAHRLFTRYLRGTDQNDPTVFRGGGVGGILETESGGLWLIADYLLVNFNLETKHFTDYRLPIPEEQQLSAIQKDRAGNLWLGGGHGLYKFNLTSHEFTHFPAITGIHDLLFDTTGILWVACANGLYRFDPQSGSVLDRYRHDAGQADSLSSDSVTTLYQDRSGLIWIGTGDAGLNLYNPAQAQFTLYRNDSHDSESLPKGAVTGIQTADNNHLWVNTGNLLNLLDLTTHKATSFSPKPGTDSPLRITALYQDRAGALWVGLANTQLLRFDAASGQFIPFPLASPQSESGGPPSSASAGTPPPPNPAGAPPKRPPGAVSAFYEDALGNFWVGVDALGLYRIDPQRKNAQFFDGPHAPPPPNSSIPTENLPLLPISDLLGDNDGGLWVSTVNGFSRFDPATKTYQAYRAKTDEPGPDSPIKAMHLDQSGTLWLASQDGLYRIDPVSHASKLFTEKDGLPSNFVVGILEDHAGNLWLSTNKGLSRFTPATGEFRNYDASDGLQANEFNPNAFWAAANGRMFFGGTGGLTAFYPEQITNNLYHPPVVLTGFRLFNKPVKAGENPLSRPIGATSSLTLNYDQNVFSFEFAALSYATPSKNQYRYKLDGFESDWNSAPGARRFATYTNLPAGDYIFRVQATNSDGVWSDQEAALKLTALPPWWETLWFRAAAGLLIVGLLAGGYQWRVYAIQRRNRLLEKQVAERTQALQERTLQLQTSEEFLRHAKEAAETANRAKSAFLANMSHELRSPLNAILGFTQVVDRNSTLSPEVHENLAIILRSGEHLLALINQVLDLSKIEAGHMTLNEVDVDLFQLLDDLEDMFSLRAKDKGLQLLFDRHPDLPRYLHTDEIKLRQILINLIGNALKFTSEGGVAVRVKKADRAVDGGPSMVELDFEVEDTGPGIALDEMRELFQAFSQTSTGRQLQEGTGLGLPISRRFAQMMGGDITVKSQVERGSTFRFNIRCQEIAGIESVERQGSRSYRRVIGLEAGQPHYRLLIVDDKWVNRHLLLKLLSPLSFDLREAENGKEAVEISQKFEPHLIWMDWRMPVMDGLEATQRIKATARGQSTIIIILTASALEEDRAIVLSAGGNDFVRKPFRAEDIFEQLSKHLGVRYTYAMGEPQGAEQTSNGKLSPNELRSAIHQLPSELVARLTEGVELGDMTMIDGAISEIRRRHAALAEALSHLAYQFEYDKILELSREATP